MATKELVIVALGSVQPFIAASRRTQDLLSASQLLSLLARVGVETADATPGTEFIFPVKVKAHWPENIPNRFVFTAPVGQGKDSAIRIQQQMKTAWESIANQVQSFFSRVAPESGWEEIWKRQVADGPEIYWIVLPWEGTDHGALYNRASLALDARKHLRWYPVGAEPGEKCTLDGIHQVLSGTQNRNRAAIRTFWQQIREHQKITPAEIRVGERLCAISVIKRFAAKAGIKVNGRTLQKERFPSTSSIAAASFRQGLLNYWDVLQGYVQAHFNALDSLSKDSPFQIRRGSPESVPFFTGNSNADTLLRYDGDIFYEETFSSERLKEMLGKPPDEAARQKVLQTLRNLLEYTQQQGIPHPHTYFAVLMLDGDKMGKLLGSCGTLEQHQEVSRVLSALADNDMRTQIERDYPGCLVYAGGDDLVALLPVQDVLVVANKLQQTFQTQLQQAGYSEQTVSCGIALIHHLQPLEWGLHAARQAVNHAKDEPLDREALVVDLIRRSGEHQRVGTKWNYDDLQPLEIMQKVQDAMTHDILSGKIGYDLLRVAPILQGQSIASHRIPPEARKAELRRLFKRRAADNKEARAEVRRLAEDVADLSHSMTGENPIVEVARWLILVRFLAQGGDI